MPSRTKLEPVGRYAMLVTLVHAVLGLGLWWWWHAHRSQVQESPGTSLAWMSPSDFATSAEVPMPTEPSKPAEPSPAPLVADATKQPDPVKAADEDDALPKAIAIDPTKAAEIMAKMLAAEQATKTEPAPASPPESKPEPAKPTLAEPPSPAIAVASKTEEKPMPTPSPVAADAVKPTPTEPDPKPPEIARPDPTTLASSAPPPPLQPGTEVARFITVSHPASAKPSEAPKAASLLELAAIEASGTGATGDKSGIRLDEVDRAIVDAFLRNWTPPNASKLPLDQRTAHMGVTVNREGRLVRFKLLKTSGSKNLDDSVLDAGNRLDKIESRLPASYPHDLYEFQVNFHVE